MTGAPPRTQYVEVDGLQLAYQVVGNGPIDLVFNHGFCHLDLQWDVAAEAAFNRRLASFSRLILFDRRGTGASERLHRGAAPTLDEWTADLLAVLDAVESKSAALFVGGRGRARSRQLREPISRACAGTRVGQHGRPMGLGG